MRNSPLLFLAQTFKISFPEPSEKESPPFFNRFLLPLLPLFFSRYSALQIPLSNGFLPKTYSQVSLSSPPFFFFVCLCLPFEYGYKISPFRFFLMMEIKPFLLNSPCSPREVFLEIPF